MLNTLAGNGIWTTYALPPQQTYTAVAFEPLNILTRIFLHLVCE